MIAYTPDNREIYYRTQGKGPELLFVHGAGSDADAYSALVSILSSQHRCVTFDRLGYSRSAHLDHPTTVEEQVAAIATVHDGVTREPAWVFAHSSGGNFALAYVLARPERVKGLVLMEPALYGIYPAEQKPPEVDRIDSVVVPLFQQGQIEKGRAEFFALFGWPATGPVSDNWRFFGYDQPVVKSWRPSDEALHLMTLPVLLMDGGRSPALLRNICDLLAAHLGNSTSVTLENQDHLAPWAAPQVVAAEIMAFIAECESSIRRGA